jgi:hypothetical protein
MRWRGSRDQTVHGHADGTRAPRQFFNLDGRRRSGLLRGLMFLDMKAGLDADVIHLRFSQETYPLEHTPHTGCAGGGVFSMSTPETESGFDI